MTAHYNIATIRPRSLLNVRADLIEARRDYEQALEDSRDDPDAEDRASAASIRLDDLQDEFSTKLVSATGLTFEELLAMRERCLI